MTRVPRHFIASRARHHASRFLLPDTKWFKLLSLYLFETLEEEYNKFPSLFALSKKNKKTKEGENSEAAPTRRCRTSRQVSQYVLFCRHMKQHQPTVTNLQNVWKQVKNTNWKQQFVTTVTLVNEVPKQHRTQWSAVMQQLLFMQEGSIYETLQFIRMHNSNLRPRRPLPTIAEESDSDSDSSMSAGGSRSPSPRYDSDSSMSAGGSRSPSPRYDSDSDSN